MTANPIDPATGRAILGSRATKGVATMADVEKVQAHHRAMAVADEAADRWRETGELPEPVEIPLAGDKGLGYKLSIELDELLAEPDEPYDWIVPNLLEAGDRVIVTGNEGQGKSTLLRQFGVQLASGIHPFDGEPFCPQSVLMVDLENSRRQGKRHLAELRKAAGDNYDIENFSEFLTQFHPEGLDLTRPQEVAWLETVVAEIEPSILIVGPLYKLMNGDPTKEEQAISTARVLDSFRQRFDCAVIIEAHSPYADGSKSKRPIRPYGASLWSRWPEFGIHLADDGRLTHWRGQREERLWPARLERGSPWPWMPADETQPERWDGPTSCMAEVLAVIEQTPDVEHSGNSLMSTLRALGHGFRDRTVRDAAGRLAYDGRISVRVGARNARYYTAKKAEIGDVGDF